MLLFLFLLFIFDTKNLQSKNKLVHFSWECKLWYGDAGSKLLQTFWHISTASSCHSLANIWADIDGSNVGLGRVIAFNLLHLTTINLNVILFHYHNHYHLQVILGHFYSPSHETILNNYINREISWFKCTPDYVMLVVREVGFVL